MSDIRPESPTEQLLQKKNPTSSDAQLECWMTKICPGGAADSLHPFSSRGDVLLQLKPTMKNPAGIQRLTTVHFLKKIYDHRRVAFRFRTTPRSAKRREKLKYTVNLQQKYAKKKTTKKEKQFETCFLLNVDKHSGRRAREDRWDILLRLTRCWKKLLFSFFQSGLHLFLPPPFLRIGGKQLQIS